MSPPQTRKLDDHTTTEEEDRPTKKRKTINTTTQLQQSEPEDESVCKTKEPSTALKASINRNVTTHVENDAKEGRAARGINSETADRDDDDESNIMFPGTNDVLLGRGRTIQRHGGNQKMLEIVRRYKEEYDAKSRYERRAFCEIVLGEVLEATSGRFLKFDLTHWTVVSRDVALDKVSHALRTKNRRQVERESEDSEDEEVYVEQEEEMPERPEEGSSNQNVVVPVAAGGVAHAVGIDDAPRGDYFARPSTHRRDNQLSPFLPLGLMDYNASLLLAQTAVVSHPNLVAQPPLVSIILPPRDPSLEEVVDYLARALLAEGAFPLQNMN